MMETRAVQSEEEKQLKMREAQTIVDSLEIGRPLNRMGFAERLKKQHK